MTKPSPQWASALAEDAEDRRFRRKVWTVALCFVAAFWIGVAGVLAMVLR